MSTNDIIGVVYTLLKKRRNEYTYLLHDSYIAIYQDDKRLGGISIHNDILFVVMPHGSLNLFEYTNKKLLRLFDEQIIIAKYMRGMLKPIDDKAADVADEVL